LRPVWSIEHAFQAACRRAKIENLQFRDPGRTYGTRLHAKGIDPLIIQRLLRHSTFRISEQVEIQSSIRMMKEAVNKAEEKVNDLASKQLLRMFSRIIILKGERLC